MAGAEQEQDRSEPATPFKLREARQRGQVAKSVELTSWITLATAVILVWMMADGLFSGGLGLSRALLDQSGRIVLSGTTVQDLSAALLWHLMSLFGLFVMLIVLSATLANFAQAGPVFSWHPLKPDFTRLNPATGFKRVFNIRTLYEAVKTCIKLVLVAAVIYFFLKQAMPALMALLAIDVKGHSLAILDQAVQLAWAVLGVLAFIAAFDLGFVKHEFAKRMRMSRREVREEIKRRDGDPKIKARIRELQREAAKRGASLRRVPDAHVLITNPTHLSIAIRYERGQMAAPAVIAKGSGELALRMRQAAALHRVPVMESRELARALFRQVPLDGMVPPETYAAVARALTWAYKQRPQVRA